MNRELKMMMKKKFKPLINGTLLLGVIAFSNMPAFAEEGEDPFLLGFVTMPLDVSGYKNAVFNDNHNYPGRSTGATYIEFEKGNTSGSATGIMFGYQFMLGENKSVVID